jgi:hypothetical protein
MKVGDKVVIKRNPNPEWVGQIGTVVDMVHEGQPYISIAGHYDHLGIDDLEVLPTLGTICKSGMALFDFCRNGKLYYKVQVEGTIYSFPVSVEDLGNSTISVKEKAITLMRYIRKALDKGHFVMVGRV